MKTFHVRNPQPCAITLYVITYYQSYAITGTRPIKYINTYHVSIRFNTIATRSFTLIEALTLSAVPLLSP